MPFPKLLTMGREECAKFIAGPRDVCISIRSSDKADPPPISANYRAVLRLVFDDIPWTDVPVPPATAQQISVEQADKVIRFVSVNSDATRLVIHCDVGASRSVSMAMALAKCFTGEDWAPTWLRKGTTLAEMRGRGKPAPNPNVYWAIVNAFDRSWGNTRNAPIGTPIKHLEARAL